MTATQRWERAMDWPLMVAALAFLAAYAVPILSSGIGPEGQQLCRLVVWVTWGFFVLDYLARLLLAEDRTRFFFRHLLDLLVIALPLLRPLRLLRLAPLLKVLNRRAASGLRGKVAVYVIGGSTLLAFCGALAVLDAERGHPEANIVDFDDAVWWAVSTMATVGYGDRYPTTGSGRLAAAGLMVSGVALLGVVTATFASWLIEQVTASEQEEDDDLRVQVAALHEKLDRVLAGRSNESGPQGEAARQAPSVLVEAAPHSGPVTSP